MMPGDRRAVDECVESLPEGLPPSFPFLKEGGGRLADHALHDGRFNVPEFGLHVGQLRLDRRPRLPVRRADRLQLLVDAGHQVWQITACDAACSYGVAWLLPAHTAEAAAHFLRRILLPVYRRAGWRLRRVLTDGGPEFKGAFDEACRALGLRHTRTKPRHAWTNGFVERLQGTILQEHWRVAFRRRYFTSRPALQRSLEAFMQSYNHERPHQGYRVRGRTPATLFWGAARG